MTVCNECKASGGSDGVIPHIHTCSGSSKYMDYLERRNPGFRRSPWMQLRDFGIIIPECLELTQLVPDELPPPLVPADDLSV